jgi:hypothetical protein
MSSVKSFHVRFRLEKIAEHRLQQKTELYYTKFIFKGQYLKDCDREVL